MSADLLETAAHALGPLLEEVVFLGGASIHLWISDPRAPATRATDDVDVISAITTRTDYYRLAERLRERGFSEASDSRVICRWRHLETGLLLDVMPQDESVLGFSNPWYRHAIEERDRAQAASHPSAWRGMLCHPGGTSCGPFGTLAEGSAHLDEYGDYAAVLTSFRTQPHPSCSERRNTARCAHPPDRRTKSDR